MDSIYKYLRDPGWWFSAFLVAILASVIAGFTKDYLERRFGLFLSWSRLRRDELRKNRADLIDSWTASETLFAIALLQMLYWVVLFVGLALVVLTFTLYLRLRYRFTGLAEAVSLPLRTVLALALGVGGLFFYGFRTGMIVIRAADALKAFCSKRGLRPFVSPDV